MIADFDLESDSQERDADPTRKATGYSGRLWPNGEFTLGYIPAKEVSEREKQFDADWEKQYEWFTREYDPQWRGFTGLMDFGEYRRLVSLSDLLCHRRVTRIVPKGGGRIEALIVTFGVLKPPSFDSDSPESQDSPEGSPLGLYKSFATAMYTVSNLNKYDAFSCLV